MRPLSMRTRSILVNDNWYKKCCLCGITGVKIDWHHNFTYKGQQSDEPTTILPLCMVCHDKARLSATKELIDLIMYKRMGPTLIMKYDKTGQHSLRYHYLQKKYLKK